MPEPLFEIRNATFTYPGAAAPVLRDCDFRFSGERLGVVGDNGSGKTTLFLMVMGLVAPQSGGVYFRGEPVLDHDGFTRLRRAVGYCFQNPDDQLFSPTVLEDVAFGPLNQGKSAAEARFIALETLARVGLAGYEERITYTLSGGEKRLASLATVLSMKPEGLLLDEPTNDLDPATRDRLVEVLRSLDIPFAIISHDWDFLDRTVDALLHMEQGRLTPLAKSALHTHTHVHTGGDAPHEHCDG
ncbi:ABC transporter ATP-binding protein [Oceanidesulfovibrio indonesiensis]|uniref:ABC transporter ATP-binding protein n=1 Tax=Oceanidesulfovibrio indonesiensis TaxID=54767 RepID=A0A7M3MIX0_9BACT|nr:ABC transporter ATP-binding protein [Oceanidesulfovibrio indonesiensis]TVM19509.1 ABC transporter ATP-binding protein [Oceanidesulfovibrio indonesiensis]